MKKYLCIVVCILSLILGNSLYRNVLIHYYAHFFHTLWYFDYYMFMNFAFFCIFETAIVLLVLWCFYREKTKIATVLCGFIFLNYMIILLCLLYTDRNESLYIRTVLNPIESIQNYGHKDYIIFLKTLMFVPLGIFLNKVSSKNTWEKILVLSVSIAVYVEILQLVTLTGTFETLDIMLYFIGIFAGYMINKKFSKFETKWYRLCNNKRGIKEI